jgi:peptidoglycan/LPS O-acetylase OafA/YrhL
LKAPKGVAMGRRGHDRHAVAMWLGVPAALYLPDAQRGSYAPSLDGMRAVAILAVVAYHLGHMPTGLFGVDVFFVISGYLITGLLADEQRRRGTISLARFYGRRALRLLPVLVVVVAGCLIIGSAVLPERQVRDLWWSTLFVATYTANFRAINYVDMPLLSHTWSLAVEEQFYVVWPLPFSRLATRVAPRRLAAWLVALAVASALWCAVDYWRGAALARLSDLPDTHASGLLIGAALALLVGSTSWTTPPRLRPYLHVLSYLAAAAVLVSFRVVIDNGAFPYLGGFLIISVLTGVVLVDQISTTPSKLALVLRHPVAVLIGRWSYSLYLVHLPVIQLLQTTDISRTAQVPLAFGVSMLLAMVLHVAVERPALRLRRRFEASTTVSSRELSAGAASATKVTP